MLTFNPPLHFNVSTMKVCQYYFYSLSMFSYLLHRNIYFSDFFLYSCGDFLFLFIIFISEFSHFFSYVILINFSTWPKRFIIKVTSSYLILFFLILSRLILFSLISSYLIFFDAIFSYFVSSYLVSSYLVSSYFVLPSCKQLNPTQEPVDPYLLLLLFKEKDFIWPRQPDPLLLHRHRLRWL